MKRTFTFICCILVTALAFSCTEKPAQPEEKPDIEETPSPEPEPEPGPEPEPQPEIKPMLDIIFNADGSINENAYAPEILNEKSMWKVLLTFGWRF